MPGKILESILIYKQVIISFIVELPLITKATIMVPSLTATSVLAALLTFLPCLVSCFGVPYILVVEIYKE